jgi:hypothetical protein
MDHPDGADSKISPSARSCCFIKSANMTHVPHSRFGLIQLLMRRTVLPDPAWFHLADKDRANCSRHLILAVMLFGF